MLKHRTERLTGARRQVFVIGLALVASILMSLGIASSASAEPKGIFNVFKDCPTEVPGNALCTYAQTTSGEFAIGSTKVPINKTVTLQGGAVPAGGAEINEYFALPAKDGNTLSKTELNVPGGLLNIVNCEEIKGNGILEIIERGTCKAIFENKTTGVTATTELVANRSNPAILNLAHIAFENGTGLVLPVRVHLKNPLLGEGCYVGSEAHPIELHLTTGTTAPPAPNKPIKGSGGEFFEEEEKGQVLTVVAKNSLVDNAFAVPTAEGCGGLFSFLITPIVNKKLGLPSAAGKNTAILSGTLKTAEEAAVLASEKF
jgi:hypothetical protein